MKGQLDENLESWSKYAKAYDPIKCASIDGTDCEPHDRAVVRAINSTYRPNRFVKGRPGCTIFVSRLNHETSKDTIKDIFSKYGKLKRFRVVKDIVTGMPKGYAFIEYEEEQAAEEAYRLANKMVVDGHIIFVDFECERLLKGWKPRRLGGGFAGKKESGQLRFGGRDRPFKKPIALELKEEEERKRREKERRLREEGRRRRAKSRDRYKRKSPPIENGIGSPGARRKQQSSIRDRAKRPLSPRIKTENGSSRQKDKIPPIRDKIPSIKEAKITGDKPKQESPTQKRGSVTSPSQERGKQSFPQEETAKSKSNFKDATRHNPNAKQKSSEGNIKHNKSPSREHTKHTSPSRENPSSRKNTKSTTKDNFSVVKPERRSPPLRRHSPPRQVGRPHSPPERQLKHSLPERRLKHSPPRDAIKRRSPDRDANFSSERDGNKRPGFFRENRSRSPLHRSNKNYNEPSRNDDRWLHNVKVEHSPRKHENYHLERENDRRRSPLQNASKFISERDRVERISPRETVRHPPLNRNDTREHARHQPPPRECRSPPRDSKRQYSPSRQHTAHQYSSSGDTRGYYDNTRDSSRDYRGNSPVRERMKNSPSAEHFQREHRGNSPGHESRQYPPYEKYNQAAHGSQEHFAYRSDGQYGSGPPYSANISPPKVDFRQPPPSYEPPREYHSFQGNTNFPPTSGNYPPPSRDAYSRDYQPPKQNMGEYNPGYFSPPHGDQRQHYPPARKEDTHYESRSFGQCYPSQKPHSFPPMRGGRQFPPPRRENDGPSNIGPTDRFPPQRGRPRGDRGGFSRY